VRTLKRIRAFGRDPERRAKFCREMSEKIGVTVEAATSSEEAVKGSDIIITATSATKVVLEGAWLAPGMHINAMGANWPQKRELDSAAVGRSDKIVVDFIEQAKMEAGDLVQAFGEDSSRWSAVQELSEIITGKQTGRTSNDQITLFKSNGIATWDLAAAVRVFEMASAQGIGKPIPLWEAIT
jgi:ornithine cyclodeaminase/alanine dehydrogenase-like protein (mu-crystallin family)